MHRTDTLDMFMVAYGEICLVTDTDEVLLRAGDTAIVQGVSNPIRVSGEQAMLERRSPRRMTSLSEQ